MATVAYTTASGTTDVDALQMNYKWSFGSALTFSFPTLSSQWTGYGQGYPEPWNNFETLNASQRAVVGSILASVGDLVSGLSFSLAASGQEANADFRFGMTDATGGAHAYSVIPQSGTSGPAHLLAGDAWFHNSSGTYDNPVAGTYAYHTFLHEIGHTLGLIHAHQGNGFGTVSSLRDQMSYSVMSYRSYQGQSLSSGYTNEAYGFAQTFMLLDIAALQHMYGADYTTNSGNTVYQWNPVTGAMTLNGAAALQPGANKVFMTVWDGGGTDTYDFSLYSEALTVDLAPGEWTLTGSSQLAYLGDGEWAVGNVANAWLHQGDTRSLIENAIGGSGNDVIRGNQAANRLDGGAGADQLTGFLGNDVYIVDNAGDVVIEAAGEGIDEVRTAIGSRTDFAAMYVLPAHVENLTGTSTGAQGVYGNALDNLIVMGGGGDLIVLQDGGVDRVESGGGNDFIYFGTSFTNADSVDGGSGYDTVGLLGTATITFAADDLVGVEKVAVYSSGTPGAPNDYNLTMINANVAAGQSMMIVAMSLTAGENLVFNGSAETDGTFDIRGGDDIDTIVAGQGADSISGYYGADTITGGGGADLFYYHEVADSTPTARDTITDFTAGDKISLYFIDADGNSANGNTQFAFIGSSAFSNSAGQLRATNSGNGWLVEGDVNGDGVADFALLVMTQNGHMIGANDFYL